MNEASPPFAERGSVLWIALGLLLVAGVVAWALVAFRAPEASAAAAPGGAGAMPQARVASLEGRDVGPADLSGRVVLYDFWATWCGPCHIQSEILKTLYPEFRGRGVEFVALATGEPEDIVRDFVGSRRFPYPVWLDPEERLASQLRIFGLPTLLVVDGGGRILYRNTGIVDARTLRRVLEEASG